MSQLEDPNNKSSRAVAPGSLSCGETAWITKRHISISLALEPKVKDDTNHSDTERHIPSALGGTVS